MSENSTILEIFREPPRIIRASGASKDKHLLKQSSRLLVAGASLQNISTVLASLLDTFRPGVNASHFSSCEGVFCVGASSKLLITVLGSSVKMFPAKISLNTINENEFASWQISY